MVAEETLNSFCLASSTTITVNPGKHSDDYAFAKCRSLRYRCRDLEKYNGLDLLSC
jgi:hypothetical protein